MQLDGIRNLICLSSSLKSSILKMFKCDMTSWNQTAADFGKIILTEVNNWEERLVL
jgi:hypothetical protein